MNRAIALSPALGQRMAPVTVLDKDVFVRGLLPQNLRFEFESLAEAEAMAVGRYLASVLAIAHARQLEAGALPWPVDGRVVCWLQR